MYLKALTQSAAVHYSCASDREECAKWYTAAAVRGIAGWKDALPDLEQRMHSAPKLKEFGSVVPDHFAAPAREADRTSLANRVRPSINEKDSRIGWPETDR